MYSRAVLCSLALSLSVALVSPAVHGQNFAPQQNRAAAPAGQAVPGQFGPQQVQPGQQAVPVQQQLLPCPFPELTQREIAYRDDILKYWEQRSAKVNRFECEFIRWDYDPLFGPKDPNVAKKISYGEIKYEKPDKGLYRETKITHYVHQPNNPDAANQAPQYAPRQGEIGEHWVSNGKSIFVFDEKQKQLIEYQLPENMQGQGIVNGPLPFLFGAKAEAIKARYHTRMIVPPPVKGQYWMEAYPKYRDDRAQYQKVLVILDEAEYLPIALQIFDRNFNRVTNPSRVSLNFKDRVENPNLVLQKLNLFHRSFFEPALPGGWTKVVEKVPAPGARVAQGAPQQARQ